MIYVMISDLTTQGHPSGNGHALYITWIDIDWNKYVWLRHTVPVSSIFKNSFIYSEHSISKMKTHHPGSIDIAVRFHQQLKASLTTQHKEIEWKQTPNTTIHKKCCKKTKKKNWIVTLKELLGPTQHLPCNFSMVKTKPLQPYLSYKI